MSSSTLSGLTGEGTATIATDWIPAKELDAFVLDSGPKTRFIGTVFPRAVRYAGHVGLAAITGVFPGDPFRSVAGPEFTIANEAQAWYIPLGSTGPNYWTSVYWRLAPGVEIDIVVWW